MTFFVYQAVHLFTGEIKLFETATDRNRFVSSNLDWTKRE